MKNHVFNTDNANLWGFGMTSKYRSFLLHHEGIVPYPDEYSYPYDIDRMHQNEPLP